MVSIDIGTGEPFGAHALQDFAMKKEVPFSLSENAPFFLRKTCPRSIVPPKFEMLPTSLMVRPHSSELDIFVSFSRIERWSKNRIFKDFNDLELWKSCTCKSQGKPHRITAD